jgi:hypothetical protein
MGLVGRDESLAAERPKVISSGAGGRSQERVSAANSGGARLPNGRQTFAEHLISSGRIANNTDTRAEPRSAQRLFRSQNIPEVLQMILIPASRSAMAHQGSAARRALRCWVSRMATDRRRC